MEKSKLKIGIVGLGYVGLPLLYEFSKIFDVLGFDIDKKRIQDLSNGNDYTNELSELELKNIDSSRFSSDIQTLKKCNIFVITVPTPIDEFKTPDLSPLKNASKIIGSILKIDDIVIYESTVYPGATEDVCVPILEEESHLKLNKDFYVGYSPERINPGDKNNKLSNIVKVTSGSNQESAQFIDELYSEIITAGTHKAPSIKVAEAAKVIENTQRDINIALMNELSIIFNRLNIETSEVLAAASTKWNFLKFSPGLVGGHCIGVDPYYLCHKSKELGYIPDVILAGRSINDGISSVVVSNLLKKMIQNSVEIKDSKVLIMGLSFKENCPDTRNTKIIDISNELEKYQIGVEIFDPVSSENNNLLECNKVIFPKKNYYDAIIIAVAHEEFIKLGIKSIKEFGKQNAIIYDVKSIFPIEFTDLRL